MRINKFVCAFKGHIKILKGIDRFEDSICLSFDKWVDTVTFPNMLLKCANITPGFKKGHRGAFGSFITTKLDLIKNFC